MNRTRQENSSFRKSPFFLMRAAVSRGHLALNEQLSRFDITAAQLNVIYAIDSGEASTARELSKMMDIDSGSMTKLIDRLEKKELITRHRTTTDKRIVTLKVTEKSRQISKDCREITSNFFSQCFKNFSDEEFFNLSILLSRLIQDTPLSITGDEFQNPSPQGENP